MLAGTGFAEESVECIVRNSDGGITAINRIDSIQNKIKTKFRLKWNEGNGPWHHAVGLNAMFEAVKLPAGVSDLNTGLTDVNADDFSHIFSI